MSLAFFMVKVQNIRNETFNSQKYFVSLWKYQNTTLWEKEKEAANA